MAKRVWTFYVPGILVSFGLIAGCAQTGSNGNPIGGTGGGGSPSASSLTVSKTHTGDFVQGQQGGTYTITVSNAAGAANTSGAVTVTESAPSGLGLVSLAGSGWSCSGSACTRSDSLAAGSSYPAITAVVNVAPDASSPQVNRVSVSGGGSAQAGASDSTTIAAGAAILNVSKTHAGDFVQGQQGATYTITVSNATAGGATNGTVTVTEAPPSGLTLLSLAGSGWSCSGSACTRSDSLPSGSSYPPITATVDVAINASSPLVNQVSVSGGGSAPATASDSTTIDAYVPPSAALSISKTHAGDFVQGQQGATYAITVSNAASGAASSGAVTVTENPPSGLTLISLAGSGWSCSGSSCARSDSLAPGSSYPVITATLNVGDNASSPQINQVSVSGGGSAAASASDSTNIDTVYGSPLIAPSAWQANTAYTMGNVVTNGGNLYVSESAGTSASSGGPAGTGLTAIADNTLNWFFYGTPTGTTTSPSAPTISSQCCSAPSDLTAFYPSVISGASASQFQYLGGYPSIASYGSYAVVLPVSVVLANGTGFQNPFGIQFVTDAARVSIAADNGNEGYELMVDGQLVFQGSQKEPHLAGQMTYTTLDFTNAGGKRMRTITLYSGPFGFGNTIFYGVAVDSASTVSAPTKPEVTACVFGDSFTAGGGNGPYNAPLVSLDSWPRRVQAILGFGDFWNFAIGGTGYLNPNGTAGDLSQLLANSTNAENISANCTLLVVNEGINDYGPYAPSAIQAAVTSDLQTLRSLVPSAPIVVTGIWPGASGIPASMIAAEQAIQAGAAATADSNTYFVPIATANPPWMSGTGNVTAPNGTGNADVCMGPSSHPTAACIANFMAPRVANALRTVLPNLP